MSDLARKAERSKELSKLALEIAPFMIPLLSRTSASSGAISGSLVAHAIDGAYHTGTLAESQAPWAVTDSEFVSHTSNANAHHLRQHDMLSVSDHTYTGGAALDVFGLSAASTLAVLTPSAAPGAASAILKSSAAGNLTLPTFTATTKVTAPIIDSASGAISLRPASGITQAVGAVRSTISTGNGGGAILQGIVDADNSAARVFVGHNAVWDGTANLWNIDNIGANDAGGFLMRNGTSAIDIIFHPSAGAAARTMDHATFIAGTKFTLTNAGRLGVLNNAPSYEVDVAGTMRATTSLITPLITTTSGDLTIDPVGVVKFPQSQTVQSINFNDSTTPFAGWQIIEKVGVPGKSVLTIAEIQADELAVKVFVADETRVDRGDQLWAKSFGILAAEFTTPAIGATASIKFEDSPALVGALGTNNDWIMLQLVDRSAGLVIALAWGQISSYISNGDGTQSWTFTMRSGPTGKVFSKGRIGINWGETGQSYIRLSTVSANAPYLALNRWAGSNPYTPANQTTLVRLGNLSGGVGTLGTLPPYLDAANVPSGNGLFVRTGSNNKFIVADDNAIRLISIDLDMYDGSGTQTVDLTSTDGSLKLGSNVSSAATTTFDFNGTTGAVRVGGLGASKPNLYWDGSKLALRQNTTEVITLDAATGNSQFTGVMTIGASGEIRQGSGALTVTNDYTGLRIWRDGSIGRIAGYNNNIIQWTAGTDGKLYAAAGGVGMDSTGLWLRMNASSTWSTATAIAFRSASNWNTIDAVLSTRTATSSRYLNLLIDPDTVPVGIEIIASPASQRVNITHDFTVQGDIDLGGDITLVSGATVDGVDISTIATTYLPLAGGTLTNTLTTRQVAPSADSTYKNGTATNRWSELHVNQLFANTIVGTPSYSHQHDAADITSGVLNGARIPDNYVLTAGDTMNGSLVMDADTGLTSNYIRWLTRTSTGSAWDLIARAWDYVTGSAQNDLLLTYYNGTTIYNVVSFDSATQVADFAQTPTAGGVALSLSTHNHNSDYVPLARTVTAGAGLTGGGALSGNITISHDDTSSQASVNNSSFNFIQDVTLDTYGHVTGLVSADASTMLAGYLKADGTVVGATAQAQTFTEGVISNGFVGIGITPTAPLHVSRTYTAPAGQSNLSNFVATASGDAGGTSDIRALAFTTTVNGSNNVAGAAVFVGNVISNTSAGVVSSLGGMSLGVRVTSAGNVTQGYGFASVPVLTAAGNITGDYRSFWARSSVLTSTGTVALSTGIWIDAQKITGVTTGRGVWQIGTSDINALAGLTAFGTTTTPTAFAYFAAGTSSNAQIRLVTGAAPTAPNSGDLWHITNNLYFYSGSTTYAIGAASSLGDLELSGELLVTSGSATTPTISNQSDTNTGIYWSAADTLSFTTGGSLRGEFSSAGLSITGAVVASSTGTFASNTDSNHTLGRVIVGYAAGTDTATFSHFDMNTSGSRALSQSAAGATVLNAATGQTVSLSINAAAVMSLNSTSVGVNVSPDSTAAFKIQSSATDDITLFLKQKASQTARMLRVEDSGGQELIVLDSVGNLQSGNPGFVSGLTGWQITPTGNAEFNNATIRGELHASIFVMDEFHASGGTLVVAPAGKLENNATVYTTTGVDQVLDIRTTSVSGSGAQLDIRTTSVSGSGTQLNTRWVENYFEITDPPSGHATILSVGDRIRAKALGTPGVGLSLYDVWGIVTRIEDMTNYYRYYYQRTSGGSNGIVIPAGTAIISYGQPGAGRILLTADQGYSPYIDIFTSGSTPWSGDITPHTRIGRLDGVGLPGVSGIEQYGIVTSANLASATAPYMVMSNLKLFSYNVDSEWNNGNPTARITSGGEFRLGTDVSADATTGLLFNPTTGNLTLGSSTAGSIVLEGNGSSYFSGAMTIGTNGGIYQGTGTFASPTTGLKIWNGSGIGRIAGYNSTTLQWYADTDGKLYAGAGNVRMDASGITVAASGVGEIQLSATGPALAVGATLPTYASGTGIWAGIDSSVAKLRIGTAAGQRLTWDNTTLSVVGAIEIAAASGFSGSGYLQVGSGTKDSNLNGWHISSSEIVGQLAGVDQVVLSTSTGRISAGAGTVLLNAAGIEISSTSTSSASLTVGGDLGTMRAIASYSTWPTFAIYGTHSTKNQIMIAARNAGDANFGNHNAAIFVRQDTYTGDIILDAATIRTTGDLDMDGNDIIDANNMMGVRSTA